MSPMYPAPTYPGVTGVPPASPAAPDALSLLRGGLAAKNANWADLLRSGLRQLRDDLREHIAAMEGPDGLYDEVRRSDPRLACAVTRLRREHGLLSAMVDDLSARVDHEPNDPADLNAVRPRIRTLLKQWAGHRRRDNQRAYDAMSLDIGGQD
ncbi:MAG: hemerythrin domain-containing protein [Streptomycetaceae bacterium]|nr:hemerythrin domain-containing protein [Streptomycetaceae bacterium]